MDINESIRKYQHLSYAEIAAKLGITAENVRKRYRRMDLPGKNVTATSWKSAYQTKDKFLNFLSKARTDEEIKQKFDLSFLTEEYEGYELFTQRDNYNQLRYILLPKFNKEFKIKKKEWSYHEGKDDKGKRQPYLLCQLPDFKGKLQIALLFDVHYGNFAHRKEKFKAYINWIKNSPNVYAILGGDLMENAIDDGRGMMYDQKENPHTQLDDMANILAPIAHKILVAVPGNHEERTYKKTGIDVMKVLADKLEVPYFSGTVLLSLLANTYKWNFYVWHGRGNSQTKGGKMNMANRPKNWTNLIHFYVSGHVHDRVCESEACIVEDPINCRLIYMPQWTVVAPAFLDWEETYAYRAGYKPPAPGGISIELFDNGDYKASLT